MEKLLLLVDDEPSILKSLKRLFRPTDYTVLTASSAYQALDIIRERPVSVLVSDYTMPDSMVRIYWRWPSHFDPTFMR